MSLCGYVLYNYPSLFFDSKIYENVLVSEIQFQLLKLDKSKRHSLKRVPVLRNTGKSHRRGRYRRFRILQIVTNELDSSLYAADVIVNET
jgi:hypothetical protein